MSSQSIVKRSVVFAFSPRKEYPWPDRTGLEPSCLCPARCVKIQQMRIFFTANVELRNQMVVCQSSNPQQFSHCCKTWGIHMGLRQEKLTIFNKMSLNFFMDHAAGFFTPQSHYTCCANTC
ncbi:hypothetical protein L596_004504 [Steinernema carpocapsae]|uniref:Uncharacterized protein n=1 Tax=Steinernema carpocapsae TaxID=34508 RepID=A0A4U8UZL3_STECR|nr:hypothetical protein L596_004504 [Steinernema carpocapsae]